MSIKLQVAAVLATTGIAASVAAPLTLVSKNSVYEFPFSKVTIEKIVEDAGKVYAEKQATEKFGDIFSTQKVEQFELLIQKIKSERGEKEKPESVVQKNCLFHYSYNGETANIPNARDSTTIFLEIGNEDSGKSSKQIKVCLQGQER